MNGIFVKKKREEQRKKNATLQGCTFNNKPRRMINRLIVLGEQSVVTIVACKRGFKRGWGCRSVAERAVRSPSGCPERGDYLSRRINQFEICSHATDRAVERAHRFFLPRSFHHHWFQTQIHRHQRASRSMILSSIRLDPRLSSLERAPVIATSETWKRFSRFRFLQFLRNAGKWKIPSRIAFRGYVEHKRRKVLWVRLCRDFVICIFFLNESVLCVCKIDRIIQRF